MDVQHNRLEYEVVGWGLDFESWSLDYGVIYGDPSQPEVWETLKLALTRKFEYESGFAGDDESGASEVLNMRVLVACIDSGGHHSEEVLSLLPAERGPPLVRREGRERSRQAARLAALVTQARGRPRPPLHRRHGDREGHASRAASPSPRTGPGRCHFPYEFERDGQLYYGEDYFKQLRAEHAVMKRTKRGTVRVWEKIKPSWRNEALDLRVYNMAALAILNPDFEQLAARRLSGKPMPQPPAQERKRSTGRRPMRCGFVPGFSSDPLRGRR